MTAIATSWLASAVLATLTGWLGYEFGTRREREKERRARNVVAATELVAPLRELQRLLRSFGCEPVERDEVAHAFINWSRSFDTHGHRLRQQWRHLARSVRDAAGTAFGGMSLVHIRPDIAQLDLGEPDRMWQDFADDYLDYASRCVLEWGDASPETPKDLMTYEAWLVRTNRREPFGTNHRHQGPQPTPIGWLARQRQKDTSGLTDTFRAPNSWA